MTAKHTIQTKRVYEDPAPDDGHRVLVDRLWPRGVSKERAHLDAWLRDLAPSTELRRWFGHDPERWAEFQKRYHKELATPERQAALQTLADFAAEGSLTLLYAARDTEHNEALVLAGVLSKRGHKPPAKSAARHRDSAPPIGRGARAAPRPIGGASAHRASASSPHRAVSRAMRSALARWRSSARLIW